MRVSTFFAATLPLAMAQVREALGPKAIVLSWRNTRGGVEISASVQADQAAPPLAQPPARAQHSDLHARPETRDDLLSTHFSPDDFLPQPTALRATNPQAAQTAKPMTRGLAALVNRQTSAATSTATPTRASPPAPTVKAMTPPSLRSAAAIPDRKSVV